MDRLLRLGALLALALGCAPTFGADTLSLAYVQDDLNRGYANWASWDARYTHEVSKTQALYVGETSDTRFSLANHTAYLGGRLPLRTGLTGHAEIGGGDNVVLPRSYASAGLIRDLGGGLLLSAGLKGAWYQDTHTVTASAGVERYLGPVRLAVEGSVACPSFTARALASGRVAADYYWSDALSSGVFMAAGSEAEVVPAGTATLSVRTAGARVHWRLTRRIATSAFLAETKNIGAYARKSAGLSLEFGF